MDKLELQSICFENIKGLCVNYRKDSSSRKNGDYLNKRLSSLETQWKEFDNRHSALLLELEDKSITYFADDVYKRTKEMYENIKTDISKRLVELENRSQPVKFDLAGVDIKPESGDDIQYLLNKQECNFNAICRVMSKINSKPVSEQWQWDDHLTTLRSKWEPIDKLHWEIDFQLKGSNEQYYKMFTAVERDYDELNTKLNNRIWSSAHYQKSAPKIELPEFYGSYSQWTSFKDLFLETIDKNPTINNAQKMHHLKTKLRGEAESLVQHLHVSAENYSSCWDILVQRYDNRRLQFTSYLNTMTNLPNIQHPDSFNLKRMHDVITECLNGMSNIGVDLTISDPVIAHLMSLKLDEKTMDNYVKSLQDQRELPNSQEFLVFLEKEFMGYETKRCAKKGISPIIKKELETKQASSNSFYKSLPAKKHYYETKRGHNKSYHTTFGQCPHCEGKHVLMQCPEFIDMDSTQRNKTVAKLQVCKNCLFSHGNTECKSAKTCKECNLKHHTLLHNFTRMPTIVNNHNSSRTMKFTQQSSNHLANNKMEILLTTVQLQIKSASGAYVTLRALLDQGSQVNLITEKGAQLLQMPRKRLNATISGIGALSGDCKGCIQLTCKSIHSDYTFDTQVLIMNKLTNNLPTSSFEKPFWPHLENLKLADPEYNISRPVDLLLGAGVYSDIILNGILRGTRQAPIAQQTQLGWILSGKTKTFNCHAVLVDLNNISKFWETEDIIQNNQDLSKDDQCEEHFARTVRRAADGKYIVKMPLVPGYEEKIGRTRSSAIAQFLQLERRLAKNEELASMYKNFIEEYAVLGHMKPACPDAASVPQCYLPHHGILREHSSTTKLRVVFNASHKTTSGLTLNNLQEKGPNMQRDIQALILKWRTFRYAYTADIEKMYRCIWIAEEQQSLQKIVWRNSPTEKLRDYQLCTVTYGMKCAPWLAMRTLKQLALDEGHKYPEAASTLQNDFYVDDLISGHDTIDGAKQLQRSLLSLLHTGGMNLRKWSANHPALLENLSKNQISNEQIFDFKHEETKLTLGLGWHTENDTFTFHWDLEENPRHRLTKRHLLSAISKLYDPLGWLAPITVTAKLLFQRVWASKLGWDEMLPSDLQIEWMKLKSELPNIRNITINRWIGETHKNIELLGFCDASEKAYSCVLYSRVAKQDGKSIITLLAAKTRVAPLSQKPTLPRMELCGALLLSQLVAKVLDTFNGRDVSIQAWSDSQVVLAWLQGDISRWEKYVANRVSKIKQVIPPDSWSYVKSELNPADCASRGMYPIKLLNFKLWWEGPPFLQTPETKAMPRQTCIHSTNIGNQTSMTTLAIKDTHFIHELINNYSSLSRVTRVTAWVLRFSANALNRMKSDANYLTTSELTTAIEHIIKYVQRSDFEQEYKQLLKKETVSYKSPMYKLNPYLDSKGIIRVGGRLSKSIMSFDMKNPVILARNGRFTQLLIEQAHRTTLHGGARLTLAYIRQRYWILGGNRAVKTKLRRCVTCHRYKPTETYQLMSDLPQQRITPARPFTHTGVDFTGHVDVKLNKGRGVRTSKGYIAIFVCMVTKAVHVELVSDLSTETFIAAFQRLCARRGTPKHMYSDCGTNFIGAAKVLRKEFEQFRLALSSEFFDEIGKLEVEWHFNAPAWPSAGGLWEAAVKSLKYHLKRVLGEQKLTFEEFTTLLSKIEACMNSRPLCPLTEDPEEFYNYLTPGHFLTGGPVLSLPLSNCTTESRIDLRRRWQLTETMLQHFWKSWSNEYLTQLQSRSKWNKRTKNIEEGDIVLVKENNLPPGKWALGRVIELHPGSDGLVRVTTVKTQNGTIKRPIVKLSPLPRAAEEETASSLNAKQDASRPSVSQTSRTRNTSNKNFKTLLMTLITMFTLFTAGQGADNVTSSAHITSLEPDRPIYYDDLGKMQIIHDEWTLVMYYNLTNYRIGLQRVESYLNSLTQLCQKTDPRYCNTTVEQLSHEMELLHHYNSLLLSPHKHMTDRKKRGLINGIGSIASSLFGVLDQEFADKYQRDIEMVHKNENHLLNLIQNQTSIVELENKVLKKTEENINRQLNFVDGFMKTAQAELASVESVIETMMATSYFNSASLATYLLLENLKEMQEILFDSVTNVYRGHMDVHLLTPVDLVEQLRIISGRLPRRLAIPIENSKDIKDIYKLLYVKGRITSNYLLFEVHIPLTSDEEFQLYKAIPVPMTTGTEVHIIQLQSPYIAVNFQKNTYISPSETEIKLCTLLDKDRLICNKNLPIFNLQSKDAPCEARLLSHKSSTPCDVRKSACNDAWIELHTANTWLAVCCGTCTLRTVCDNDVTSYLLTTTTIVTLKQGCLLQSQDFTIYSHTEYSTNMQMKYNFYVPPLNTTVNKIVNLTHYNQQWKVQRDTLSKETEDIEKRILSQKEREVFPSTMYSQDVHLYIISYSLLGIAITTMIVWVVRKYQPISCFFNKHKRAEQNHKDKDIEDIEDIELQERTTQHNNRGAGEPPTPQRRAERLQQLNRDNIAFNFEE